MKTLASWMSLAFVLTLACGESPAPSPTSITGSWTLDKAEFAKLGAKTMVESGLVPAHALAAAEQQLATIEMSIELESTGSFRCTTVAQGQKHEYTGRWEQIGDTVRIEQTHEDGEPKADLMAGRIEAGKLRLTHDEQGVQMPYILRRAEAADPGR